MRPASIFSNIQLSNFRIQNNRKTIERKANDEDENRLIQAVLKEYFP